MLDPRSWFGKFEEARIDRPIFLLGVQGGGLTFLYRRTLSWSKGRCVDENGWFRANVFPVG